MAKRLPDPTDNDDPQLDKAARLDCVAELATTRGQRKGALANVLRILNDRGLLRDPLLSASPSNMEYVRQINRSIDEVGYDVDDNIYGPMIQTLKLETRPKPYRMSYINPFALIYHLCMINVYFFDLLYSICEGGAKRLRIILYVDEINPGNPVKPDPQLLTQAIYWAIPDFPSWFLKRKDSWFVFSVIKSNIIHKLQGYMTELMALVLQIFFSERGHNFMNSCSVKNRSTGKSFVFAAVFHGFLADEKALKEVFGITGSGGNVPCISCLNVVNRWVSLAGKLMHHFDTDVKKWVECTHAHIQNKVERLKNATSTQRKKLQTDLGINYYPTGLLFNAYLMASVLLLPNCYVRDWMHTFVSHGMAGNCLGLICTELRNHGVTMEIVRAYAYRFNLPYARNKGKVSDMFFKDALMTDIDVRVFASDVLGMVSLLWCFLVDKIKPRRVLEKHIECFELLYQILCTFRRSVITSDIYKNLHDTIVKHNALFLELYGDLQAKLKFHHSMHVPGDLYELGKAMSCFVGERKNKDALSVAVATDVNISHTATITFLRNSIAHWNDNRDACRPTFMVNAKIMQIEGSRLAFSKHASLPSGEVYVNDMVILVDDSIAKVIGFWGGFDSDQEELRVQVDIYQTTSFLRVANEPHAQRFLLVDDIVEAVEWCANSDHITIIRPKCL